MEFKIAGKASLKRGFRFFKARNQKNTGNNIVLEAITKAKDIKGGEVVSCAEEDGVVRMKILVKKSELKQLIQVMSGCERQAYEYDDQSFVPSLSVEQRFNLLLKKHLSRAKTVKGIRHNSWSPALQSIPEEL